MIQLNGSVSRMKALRQVIERGPCQPEGDYTFFNSCRELAALAQGVAVLRAKYAARQAKMIQAVLNGPALPGSKQIDPAHVAKVFSFHIVRA